jgi:hypothetical protein
MLFDTDRKLAFIYHNEDNPKFIKALWFEQLFGEIISECIINEIIDPKWEHFDAYANKNSLKNNLKIYNYNNIKNKLINDLATDYASGIDIISIDGKRINSKLIYRLCGTNTFHIGSYYNGNLSLNKLRNIDYISIIVPNEYKVDYLYLIPKDECIDKCDYMGNICFNDIEKFALVQQLTNDQQIYYEAGFNAGYNNKSDILSCVNDIKKQFTKRTGYTLIEMNKISEEVFNEII